MTLVTTRVSGTPCLRTSIVANTPPIKRLPQGLVLLKILAAVPHAQLSILENKTWRQAACAIDLCFVGIDVWFLSGHGERGRGMSRGMSRATHTAMRAWMSLGMCTPTHTSMSRVRRARPPSRRVAAIRAIRLAPSCPCVGPIPLRAWCPSISWRRLRARGLRRIPILLHTKIGWTSQGQWIGCSCRRPTNISCTRPTNIASTCQGPATSTSQGPASGALKGAVTREPVYTMCLARTVS